MARAPQLSFGWRKVSEANLRQLLLLFIDSTRWLLRYAPRFHGKKSKKHPPKKIPKKIPKKFQIFFSKN
jgi:hypothetical protein